MPELCVVCPSRDRPEDLRRCYHSMLATSENTKMIVRIDIDQATLYESVRDETSSRLEFRIGKKVGPAASVNEIPHFHRDPLRLYGVVPDDSLFKTPNWDEYVLKTFEQFPGRIGVISAAHNGGDYVNFPWVSREWIETVGWYFYPGNFHHCADSILEILGEGSQSIVYATPEEFLMHHDLQPTYNRAQFEPDAANFLFWCVGERRSLVRRILEAKRAATESQ